MDLESRDTATVIPDALRARWSSSGHIVYSHSSGALFAVPLDLRRLEVTGQPQSVLDGVATNAPEFDISSTGTLVYHAGAAGVPRRGRSDYWWMGADGSTERIPIETVDGHTDGELSPDGTRIAYIRAGLVHVFDLDLGTDIPLTVGAHDPVWSPDGGQIAFRNDQGGGVWAMASDASGEPRLLAGLRSTSPRQWLDDGTILVNSFNGDVWAVDGDPGTPAQDIFVANWDEYGPAVSPDGRWIAYASDEDGVPRGYLRSWPDLGPKTLVTGIDTLYPDPPALHWGPNSRTLYYVTSRPAIVSVTINRTGGLQVSDRTVVTEAGTVAVQDFDTGRNRFLVKQSAVGADDPDGLPEPNRLVVITNFFEELKAKMEN